MIRRITKAPFLNSTFLKIFEKIKDFLQFLNKYNPASIIIKKMNKQEFTDEKEYKEYLKENPIISLIGIIITIYAVYLSQNCTKNNKPLERALWLIFSFLFSGIYLIYYFFVYYLKDKKC
tara:strand:+ start:181 stop:540 length:360 start_codon:yes stop_codon:yes gene_type:complete